MNLRLIKWFVFSGCLIALTIESLEMYKDYNNYRTVVSVNISKQRTVEYPGVSVCESHHMIQLEQDFLSYPTFPIQKGLWFKAKQRDAQKLYKMVNQVISNDDFLAFFLQDNMLAKDSFGPIDGDFITCTIKSTGQSCSHPNFVSGFFSECKTFFNTIYYVNGSTKVLPSQTYQITDNARDNEMALIQIKKNQTNDYHSNQIAVLIIPSDSIPLFPTQKLGFRQNQLKFGKRYDVTFAKTTIKKLQKPYKPYCTDYNQDEHFKSYYDCTSKCVHSKIFEKYNCSFIGIDLILNNGFDDKKMCGVNETLDFDFFFFAEIVPKCKTELCLPSCKEEIYSYEVKDVSDSPTFINEKIDNETIIINILPRDVEEFTYVHSPKISRNDLFSKFGGLISLWLGFSFYSIYSHIEYYVKCKCFKVSQSQMNSKTSCIFS